MKKILLIAIVVCSANICLAQKGDDDRTRGFKKENLFTGGSLTLSFFNGATSLGISPYFGYSINRFVDVAASMGVNYISQRDYIMTGDKARQTVYGPGAFVRLFPVNFLFAHAQYEHNFVRFKYIPSSANPNGGFIEKLDANSVLVGAGYCSGRDEGQNTYYYLSVLWDVAKVEGSPYLDGTNRPIPIIKAGLNIGLFQGDRGGGRRGRSRYDD